MEKIMFANEIHASYNCRANVLVESLRKEGARSEQT